MVHHNEHTTLCLVGIFLVYCFSMQFEVLDISIYVQYFTSFSMVVTDNRPSSK